MLIFNGLLCRFVPRNDVFRSSQQTISKENICETFAVYWTGGKTIEDTEYICHPNGVNNFKLALTHDSLNSKHAREVHGGCTPEELLASFIMVSNKKSTRTVEKFTFMIDATVVSTLI
jgi:hypothetical protein